jgi:hypothetical protein
MSVTCPGTIFPSCWPNFGVARPDFRYSVRDFLKPYRVQIYICPIGADGIQEIVFIEGLTALPPDEQRGIDNRKVARLDEYRWEYRCRGLYQLPEAA